MDGDTILDDDKNKLTSKNDDDDIKVSMNSSTKASRF
jgi:hypothetical protein